MARLYRRGPCWYLDWHEHGQRFQRSLGKVDRKTAKAIQAEKDAQLAGLIAPRSGVTVAVLIEGYLSWYEDARPTTYRRARSALGSFVRAFGPLAADGVPPARVEAWQAAQKAKASSYKAVKLAKAAFRRAFRHGTIRANPLEAVQATQPPVSRAPEYYRDIHLRALYGTAHAALWRFMVNTGVRRGEMAKAKREDVRDGILYVESVVTGRTKSGKWRAIPLNADALAALGSLGAESLAGACADTLSDWFKADAMEAGIPGTLHWLRHTFCTRLVQAGVSLYDVKMLAGHSSITVTEKYAHHAPSAAIRAVQLIETVTVNGTVARVSH
jgi:integrase